MKRPPIYFLRVIAWYALPWLFFPFTTWYFWGGKNIVLQHTIEGILVLGGIAGAFVATKRLRRKLTESNWRLCPKCGYDMNGLDDERACPECGRMFNAAADAKRWKEFGGG